MRRLLRRRGELLNALDKLHTTKSGEERIRKNIVENVPDVTEWAKAQITRSDVDIKRVGKNYQVAVGQYRITVNAGSLTVITAHKISNER